MVMKWLNNNKDIKLMFIILMVIAVGLFVLMPNGNQDSAPMMYEDEMIVPIDDYNQLVDYISQLQKAVIVLQEGMELLLAGGPQSPATPPSLTTEQEQFMCMQKSEDYKDGFLEISTILTCMNLQLTEQEQSMKNNMIKENQEQELNRIRHEIEVAKLKLELEQLKMQLPIEVK